MRGDLEAAETTGVGGATPPAPPARPGRLVWRVLGWVALLGAGAVVGATIGVASRGTSLGPPARAPGWFPLAAFVPLLFLVLAVHEAGHLLGGRLVGFRFFLFIIGPLRIARERGGVRAGLNTNPALYGGLAGSAPTDDRDLTRRMAVMTAGGPLASLALALLAGAGFFGLARGAGAGAGALPYLAAVLGLGAALSFGIFAATIVPGHTSGFFTDGARLLRLLRGGSRAARESALLALTAASLGGRRPRDWRAAWLARATAHPDGTLHDPLSHWLAYYRALDWGDTEAAEAALERALALRDALPAVLRPGLALEAAFFTARHRGDAAAARAWLAAGKGGLVDDCTRRRAEAAVLLAEGRRDDAGAKAREGLAALARAKDPGTAAAEEEWLRDLLARAEGRG